MSNDFKVFDEKVEELVPLGTPTIAMGLIEPDEKILESLRRAEDYAEIILVGPEAIADIEDFDVITNENPEEKLATMLAEDEVDGIIRGTIDDFKTYETYSELTGEEYTIGPGLLEDPNGRQFFASPLSNPEGWKKEDRYEKASGIASFIEKWNIEPKIGVFTGTRHKTYERKKDITEGVTGKLNKTYEDAEWIVERLEEEGYHAKNWAIDLNVAVEEGYNLLIPVNGMVGNQIFRVLLFCGGTIKAATRLGISHWYEDNSRTEKDFEFHVKWLTALINKEHQES